MCGLTAILDPSGTAPVSLPSAICATLRHRGPDGEDVFRSGPATLIHTRLAIIDVVGGDQPLHSEDGQCSVIVNGEIYNQLDLRAELEAAGHRFKTRSDSEVVLHGYEEWGVDVLRRLNGMFGFALWDARRQRLLIARDPYGVKPIYWWSDGRRLVAGSEIGPILATGWVRPDLDEVALDHLLAWRFVPAPRTLFSGIHKLAAASYLVSEGGSVRVHDYRESPGQPLTGASTAELEAELTRGVVGAVQRQMMSDVPYGAFLSGGIDSAAVAAAMARAGDGRPQTFTIGFPGAGDFIDERAAAAQTAALIGTDHRDTALVEGDFLAEVAACVRRLEEPTGTASAPALHQLSRFVAQHVKVVLSGQGADEPLGGYPRHRAAAALSALDRVPRSLSGAAIGVADLLPRNERAKRAARLLDAAPGTERLLRIFEITDEPLRRSLLPGANGAGAEERRGLAGGVLAHVGDRTGLEQALYLDTHLFLPDNLLVYGDKMSMAWSLEQRVPFLDVELMRFVERIPAPLRVHRLQSKWVYKRAMRDLVPAPALERPKHPFATPYDRWLRSGLGEEVERRYRPESALGQRVEPSTVGRLVAEHRSGRKDHKRVLYCLLELALWHEQHIEQPGRLPAAA